MGEHNEKIISSRNSSFELLRIVAMWMIVFYHFHTNTLEHLSDNVFFRVVQIPLHVSVPLFIMISGYYGIRVSLRGLSNLLSTFGFFSLFVLAAALIAQYLVPNAHSVSFKQIIGSVFFISRTNNLWFIRTYMLLYFVSPFWNKILINQSKRERTYLILVLFFIVCYVGMMTSFHEITSHSLLTFLLYYSIGWTIKEYNVSQRFSFKVNLIAYSLFEICLIFLFVFSYKANVLVSASWSMCMMYNSIFCVISSILLFLLFSRKEFHNASINYIATSVLAVYLLSENSLSNVYINDFIIYLYNTFGNSYAYLFVIILSLLVFIFAIVFDIITRPLQSFIAGKVNYVLDKTKSFLDSRFYL